MIRAGLPATMTLAGTSEVTTLPAATTDPSLIVVPITIAPVPIQTWSPMWSGWVSGRGTPSMMSSWPLPSSRFTFHEMAQFEPMVMCSQQVTAESKRLMQNLDQCY
jgi:hypothetical protein